MYTWLTFLWEVSVFHAEDDTVPAGAGSMKLSQGNTFENEIINVNHVYKKTQKDQKTV